MVAPLFEPSEVYFYQKLMWLTFSISHLFNIFIANIWLVVIIRTTHTSPNAPRPITLTTSKSSRVNRNRLITCTIGFTKSIKSETVFSRRNDELQHSSCSTSKQSSKPSTETDFLPDVCTASDASNNKLLDSPFSIISESSWCKRFKPETAPENGKTKC